jgi:hypothetical protein
MALYMCGAYVVQILIPSLNDVKRAESQILGPVVALVPRCLYVPAVHVCVQNIITLLAIRVHVHTRILS